MKFTELLLFGLALLPCAALANQPPVSVCVNALEQVETLQTIAPVYKLTGVPKRQYLADADRPAILRRRRASKRRRTFFRPLAFVSYSAGSFVTGIKIDRASKADSRVAAGRFLLRRLVPLA